LKTNQICAKIRKKKSKNLSRIVQLKFHPKSVHEEKTCHKLQKIWLSYWLDGVFANFDEKIVNMWIKRQIGRIPNTLLHIIEHKLVNSAENWFICVIFALQKWLTSIGCIVKNVVESYVLLIVRPFWILFYNQFPTFGKYLSISVTFRWLFITFLAENAPSDDVKLWAVKLWILCETVAFTVLKGWKIHSTGYFCSRERKSSGVSWEF
jgi:hypothetical protein